MIQFPDEIIKPDRDYVAAHIKITDRRVGTIIVASGFAILHLCDHEKIEVTLGTILPGRA